MQHGHFRLFFPWIPSCTAGPFSTNATIILFGTQSVLRTAWVDAIAEKRYDDPVSSIRRSGLVARVLTVDLRPSSPLCLTFSPPRAAGGIVQLVTTAPAALALVRALHMLVTAAYVGSNPPTKFNLSGGELECAAPPARNAPRARV